MEYSDKMYQPLLEMLELIESLKRDAADVKKSDDMTD